MRLVERTILSNLDPVLHALDHEGYLQILT